MATSQEQSTLEHTEEQCSRANIAVEVMALLSKPHMLRIIHRVGLEKSSRFNELKRDLDISATSLSRRLKELESATLVTRLVFVEVPLRVEYQLTPAASELFPIIEQILEWTNRNFA